VLLALGLGGLSNHLEEEFVTGLCAGGEVGVQELCDVLR
jgi:hypothetical protein